VKDLLPAAVGDGKGKVVVLVAPGLFLDDPDHLLDFGWEHADVSDHPDPDALLHDGRLVGELLEALLEEAHEVVDLPGPSAEVLGAETVQDDAPDARVCASQGSLPSPLAQRLLPSMMTPMHLGMGPSRISLSSRIW
jgi:hypothetical protein